MKMQRITLDVPFDTATTAPPIIWDWDLMLQTEGCVVIGADPVREHEPHDQIGEAVATHQSDPNNG